MTHYLQTTLSRLTCGIAIQHPCAAPSPFTMVLVGTIIDEPKHSFCGRNPVTSATGMPEFLDRRIRALKSRFSLRFRQQFLSKTPIFCGFHEWRPKVSRGASKISARASAVAVLVEENVVIADLNADLRALLWQAPYAGCHGSLPDAREQAVWHACKVERSGV